MHGLKSHAALWSCFFFAVASGLMAQPDRIAGRIEPGRYAILKGLVHPKAAPQNDLGPVDPRQRIGGVSLILNRSQSQQAELDGLLEEQRDPNSPNFRNWLTPEQYARRFGVSRNDIDKIVAWLQSESLAIDYVARGRNWIAVSGTAFQVETAFHTPIHHYRSGGKMHFANAAEPSIPAAIAPLVLNIRGLDDFRPEPGPMELEPLRDDPAYTASNGTHSLVPGDIATIYNINSLYSSGVDGSGQTIAVIGQTQVDLSDIENYRSRYGLPSNDPQMILAGDDPGFVDSQITEANLDLEWAGAIAPNATILFVYSQSAMHAAQYAIDNNLAPVISYSYANTEMKSSSSRAASAAADRSFAQEANAFGITWLAASGDAAAADGERSRLSASGGLAVAMPASVPEVTAVGGTEFDEGSGNYWSTGNTSTWVSARSYIPERAWNDTPLGKGIWGSGGGASVYFSKPSWQTGPGVPDDNARDLPDIALTASGQHDPYRIVKNGSVYTVGGTSASTPVFAGIVALLNHYLMINGSLASPGLGNINPTLYGLARTTSGVFHDITVGDNVVPCDDGSSDCTDGSFGYRASPGYDQVTGLGSVDAYNLAKQWIADPASATVTTLTVNPVALR
jgi:subtilase family serine protease